MMADANPTDAERSSLDSGNGQLTTEKPPAGAPSRAEMWEMMQTQQETIRDLESRVEQLEGDLEESTQAVTQAEGKLEEVAQQLREGSLSGEAGADLLAQLNDFRITNKTDSRAWWLYLQLVKRGRVGQPVKTSEIVDWRQDGDGEPFIDTANPNQTCHRVMDRLKELTEDDLLIGEVDTYLWKGCRAVEMVGGTDE